MNICQLTEKAIKSFLDAAGLVTVTNIYRGIEGSDTQALSTEETHRSLPCVIAECAGATPNVLFSGNWEVSAVIRVWSQADDTTEAQHHSRAQEVFGKIITDTIAADLSAFAGYTAFLVLPTAANTTRLERHWESSITLRVICAPADIA